jgi:two-component system KDP operon response regulator KdpE
MTERARARVLVVDDEPLNRDLLRRILGNEFTVREAEDGTAALRELAREACEVLVADHAMPQLSGAALIRRVAREQGAPVCLLMTGYEEDPDVLACRADGTAFALIPKPWTVAAVLDAVRKAVGETARRRSSSAG